MLKNAGNEQAEQIKKIRNLEESEFVETNLHESELRKIFQTAGIDYGRIDLKHYLLIQKNYLTRSSIPAE